MKRNKRGAPRAATITTRRMIGSSFSPVAGLLRLQSEIDERVRQPCRARGVLSERLGETRAYARLARLVANRAAGGLLDGAHAPRQLESLRREPRDAAVHDVDRAPDSLHRAARAGQDAEFVEQLLEILGKKSLRPVGERGLGGIVDLDHESVHTRAPRRARETRHEVAPARGMRGIREEREMREAARYEEAAEVECPARRLLERADATLAEDHVLAARVEQVLGRGEPLLDGRSEPAFQKDGAGASARFLQEVVVLAVPRADLQHVDPLGHRADLRSEEHT